MPRASSAATSSVRSAATAILKRSKRACAWRTAGTAKNNAASSAAPSARQPRRGNRSMSMVGDPKQAKEVSRRCRSHLFHRNVAKAGDFLGDVTDVRGLVELAAKRHRRQIRRVGLDQHPVKRYAPSDILDLLRILESDNAGKGNVKPQIECATCHVPAFGEAVHDAPRFPGPLLAHDRKRVRRGRAGMDHQRD